MKHIKKYENFNWEFDDEEFDCNLGVNAYLVGSRVSIDCVLCVLKFDNDYETYCLHFIDDDKNLNFLKKSNINGYDILYSDGYDVIDNDDDYYELDEKTMMKIKNEEIYISNDFDNNENKRNYNYGYLLNIFNNIKIYRIGDKY